MWAVSKEGEGAKTAVVLTGPELVNIQAQCFQMTKQLLSHGLHIILYCEPMCLCVVLRI